MKHGDNINDKFKAIDEHVERLIADIDNGGSETIPTFTIGELDILNEGILKLKMTNAESGKDVLQFDTVLMKIREMLNELHKKQIIAQGMHEYFQNTARGENQEVDLDHTAKIVSRIDRDRIKRNGTIL